MEVSFGSFWFEIPEFKHQKMALTNTLVVESDRNQFNSNITDRENDYNDDVDLICYGKEDLAPMLEFLYVLSSAMQYILLVIAALID